MKASAAASFWIAIKFAAARHTMPNATFTSYVTGETTIGAPHMLAFPSMQNGLP